MMQLNENLNKINCFRNCLFYADIFLFKMTSKESTFLLILIHFHQTEEN